MRLSLLGGVITALVIPAVSAAQDSANALPANLSTLLGAEHSDAELIDPVAALKARMEAGEVVIERDPDFGYLPSVLKALDIQLSSQSLVFSRTSLQVDMIAPWSPRALYFNDDVYVGYTVDGLVVEVASVDPDDGAVFYTVDQRDEDEAVFRRDDLTCKACHATGITGGVPGVLMRSYLTDRMGNTVVPIEERPVDDRTPMDKRFGGWYVTGSHTLPHSGNTRAEEMVHEIDQPVRYLEGFDATARGDVLSLADDFDQSFYLTQGSDIVALMVLAHQTRVHNLITLAGRAADEALKEQELARLTTKARGETAQGELSDAATSAIDFSTDQLVRGMLFYKAEPIGQVEGTSTFVDDFEARGPWDSQRRSLRDFSLDGRLFEYPLSFLVYSDAWDALPDLVKDRAYERIHEILTGPDDPDYPLLDEATRQAVFEILMATKPDFASRIATVDQSP